MKLILGTLLASSIVLDIYVALVLYEEWYVGCSLDRPFHPGMLDANFPFSILSPPY